MAQVLSNLPIGAKIKFGKYSVNGEAAQPIIWLVVAKNHSSTPAYPTNSVTLLSAKIIDSRPVDAREPNNSNANRVTYGNNRYSLSNIDQWLNKDSNGGAWYTAQHSADQSPSDTSVVYGGTAYAARPGFLNAFTLRERNAILNTTIRVALSTEDGASYEDISRKVFLPSMVEVGATAGQSTSEGSKWSYFESYDRTIGMTDQAYTYSLVTSKPGSVSDKWTWWLRSPKTDNPYSGITITTNGGTYDQPVYYGHIGIRPALNLSSTISVSDTTDSDGCYSVSPNSAPSSPASLTLPTNIYGGKTNTISWGSATDADGDAITYQLECSMNGGDYSQIYYGTSRNYSHPVAFGTSSVSYRVRAIDTSGVSSAYITSSTKTVVNNNAPVISGTDVNLGVKSKGFTGIYVITDANSDVVTVTEAIDGVQIRSLVATLGTTITYGITGTTWLALSNGSHTLTITATDGIDTSVRTYTFTKLVDKFTIQNATPWAATNRPSRIMLVITRNIPSTATFKVEVCNNGYDDYPVWENATAAVTSGRVHPFVNGINSAGKWGVLVRVTVERNGATGACYVSAIGGNFE